jgi:hypothetical protein
LEVDMNILKEYQPWSWRQHCPLKCFYPWTRLHYATIGIGSKQLRAKGITNGNVHNHCTGMSVKATDCKNIISDSDCVTEKECLWKINTVNWRIIKKVLSLKNSSSHLWFAFLLIYE